MERIILLSDLWGKEKSEWIHFYLEILQNYFVVEFYDSCDLGNIDTTEYTEEKLHQKFLDGGIETAVKNLLERENQISTVLGFSVGGYIGWKAVLAGLKIDGLFAISSTRIRYEDKKPPGTIELYYGEEDNFKPNTEWFRKLELKENIYKKEEHNLYQKKEIAESICKKIINHSKLRSTKI